MSFFYVLDARIKLLFILLLTVLVFMIDKLFLAVILLVLSAVFRFFVKIPLRGFKLIKNLTLLAAIIISMQMIFAHGETYILKPLFPSFFPFVGGLGSLTMEGFFLGVLLTIRLAALVIILPIFTETTPAYKITAALCAMGIRYRAAFVITTAFSLIPVFRDEALVIMDAQKLRGNVFEKGSFFSKIRAYTSLLMPLMLNAMRKAQISSAMMEARAFGIYKTRTWIDKPVMKKRDFVFIFIFIIIFTFFIYMNYK